MIGVFAGGILRVKPLILVEDGKIFSEAFQAEEWTSADGVLLGKPQQMARCDLVLQGDFSIKSRLSIKEINGTAASFMLSGAHLGFDGRGNRFFLEGHRFPREHLMSNSEFIQAGQPFDLEVKRVGENLSILIDDKELKSFPYHGGPVSGFGFRPHRNEMRIYRCGVEGKTTKIEPLNYVFKSGENGYKTYRIPAMVKSTKGTLLIFAEGRVDGQNDFGNIDIVLKRSVDGGKTWGKLAVIQDDGKWQCGNPAPLLDAETGRLFLFTCGSHSSEHAVIGGAWRARRLYIPFR
ncbi:MAG: sialidase-1 [Rhodothermales bacterium]|jgi:sialidase-1